MIILDISNGYRNVLLAETIPGKESGCVIRNFLQRVMYGRYGSDQLSFFLLGVYVLLYFISSFARLPVLSYVGTVLLLWGFFRILSRNYDKRRAENAAFLKVAGPVIRWFKLRRCIRRDKEHCYFTCPNCKQQLRAPRGKGKIHVTCRNCGTVFEKKT